MSAQDRIDILDEAKSYVTKDRNTSYGEPEDNFSAIAQMWNAQGVSVDGRAVQPHDVALMMVGMKLARLRHNPTHRDSWTDGIGYGACGWDIASRMSVAPKVVGVNMSGMAGDEVRAAWNSGDGKTGGWVSPNNCGMTNPQPHAGHSYSSGSRGFDALHTRNGAGYWCDGYLDPGKVQQAADIETVKRVADKQRACNGKEPHHDCSVKATEPGS